MEKVSVLDEETRGMCEGRMRCSKWKGNARGCLWCISGGELRERNLLEAIETVFLANFFFTAYSNLYMG